MTKRLLTFLVLTVLAAVLAACGSSTAPGVQQAPSAGLTAEAATPATATTPTTSTPTTTTPSTPLPAALSKKPTVAIPSGPPPKKLVIKDIIKGTGPVATPTSTVTVQYVGVVYKGASSSTPRGTTAVANRSRSRFQA